MSIPPRYEMLICGKINDYCHDIKGIGITEPSETFHKAGKAMIGRTIATANENVPVRLMNPLNEEVIVYKGTIVGQFEHVKEDSNKVNLGVENSSSLPEQLEELISQASVNLEEVQIQSVRKPLVEYLDAFTLTDEQLGRA